MSEHIDSRSDLPSRAGGNRLPELASGRVVGRFTLLEFLGEGGMGSVWSAEDPTRKDDRRDGRVVLKFLRDDIRRCPEAVEQFRSAYRKVQQLFHEHICPLLDLGDDPVFGAFQVMPYAKGVTLLEHLKKADPNHTGLSVERVLSILRPVAKALDYAHGEGLVHRDIKPGNIMVDVTSGKVFVVDFGLAAEVRTSMSQHSRSAMGISGTEPYMAPEQWLGQAQDGRSDQYSVAVVAWQMLTGSLPYHGSGMTLGFAVTQGPIPELPKSLQHLQPAMTKALAKNRALRFASCERYLDEMSSFLCAEQTDSRPTDDPRDVVRPSDNRNQTVLTQTHASLKQPQEEVISIEPVSISDLSRSTRPSTKCRMDFESAVERINAGMNSRHFLLSRTRDEIIQWKREAESGVPEAQWLIGDCYLEGVHDCVDDSLARQWMQKAPDRGLSWGHATLGDMLIKGIGGETDIIEGINVLRKAVSAGCIVAKLRLASQLMKHVGRSQLGAAEELFHEAAESGHPGAMYRFARKFLATKANVESNSPQYINMIRDAADAGYIHAKVFLARMMLGDVPEELVTVNIPAAIELLSEVAVENHSEAITLLEKQGIWEFRSRIKVANGASMVCIPAGRFLMGSDNAIATYEASYRHENPQHSVLITHDFWLSETVVTQLQYKSVLKKNPSRHRWSLFDGGKRPVEQVTWLNAVHYCNDLSQLDGLAQYYLIEKDRVLVSGGNGYRLPTEAEWEFACRARTGTLWSWGSNEESAKKYGAFGVDQISAKTDVVGLHQCNDFGLYDMHGGVWEWCQDFYGEEYYSESPSIDPQGPRSGLKRVARGGSYWEPPWNCRSATRAGYMPDKRDQDLGFRVARSV
jgi:formylglycine-generating enzyme required for sulfatase activity/serine/threonine protein kinase